MMRSIAVLGSVSLLVATALPQQIYISQGVRYRATLVAADLKAPVALVFLPDGTALLAERRRVQVSRFDPRTMKLTPINLGLSVLIGEESGIYDPKRPPALSGEDAGLHDVALHPEYDKNGWVYISYSSGPRERSTTAVDRFRLRGNDVIDRERIFTADAYSEDRFHYGGRMVFKDGFLYVTIGDRHHQDRAQELNNHAGKILRLTNDGKAPPDNPFVGQKDAKPEIWSYGHRNPQGLILDAATGELWSHEHGPLGGDELNVIKHGANYGWPVISYGWQYEGGPIGMGIVRREGMEQPIWVWTPGIAPSGLIRYTGDKFPQWRGSFFTGAMGHRHLNRIVIEEGRVVLEERLMNRKIGRVRLVAQSPDGFIYVGCDDGKLLRIEPAD
jgi:aldose sugar dehydrogenase